MYVLASVGIADAAPPAGTPVFIQVQGLAPTSVGQNGFGFCQDRLHQFELTGGVVVRF